MDSLSKDHLERIERIRRKLKGRDVQLNPKLNWQDIEEFERRYQIHLPEDYGQFLTEIGNGGGGPPFYGIVSLAESIPGGLNQIFRPDLPFPLSNAWTWEDEIDWDKELSPLLDEVRYHGHLYLGTNGDGEDWILIITGDERGHVWNRADVGASPCIPGRDFLSWYEYWLDGGDDWHSMNKRQ